MVRKRRIVLGTILEKKPYGLVISLTGKNSKYQNKPPFASNLYLEILHYNKNNLIFSDGQISNEGYKIWKNLLKNRNQISVYDIQYPGKTYQKIDTIEKMGYFFKNNDKKYTQYRYVLSESVNDVMGLFHIRRYRELNNMTED